ncbi:hypothetical protein IFM89_013651 [Coptis chinensis]|uniref:Uncharacterized protein n=1 Tax=Coptis chinensis TaxID=261450 RepID=A0A835IMN8_9MAGN|nr:hypothetical protein IFM89_013651 [Coptis chinensis]
MVYLFLVAFRAGPEIVGALKLGFCKTHKNANKKSCAGPAFPKDSDSRKTLEIGGLLFLLNESLYLKGNVRLIEENSGSLWGCNPPTSESSQCTEDSERSSPLPLEQRYRVAAYVTDWKENQNEGSKDRATGLGTEAIEPPNWPLQFCEVWDTRLKDFVSLTWPILSSLGCFATGGTSNLILGVEAKSAHI